MEHVIREQNIWAAYEILEMFCEFILARVPNLESQRYKRKFVICITLLDFGRGNNIVEDFPLNCYVFCACHPLGRDVIVELTT